MIVLDFLFLLMTGLLSLYPISKLVKYRDRKNVLIELVKTRKKKERGKTETQYYN
jgi:hypothetical protein